MGDVLITRRGGGGGSSANIQALTVTANGTYTASGGVDGYSPVTVNVSGGGGLSNTDAVLIVSAPTGSTITAAKGVTTLTPTIWVQSADNTMDTAIFAVPASTFDANAWTVTATLGADSASDTVVINSNEEYEIELIYKYWIFRSGVGEAVPLTTNRQTNGTISIGTTEITVSYTSSTNGGVCCYNTATIDASGFSTLHVIATITDSFSTANWRGMAFAATSTPNASDANTNTKYVAKTYTALGGVETDNMVDLTSLSSSELASLYVGYRGVNKGTITNIYLTR